MNDAGKLMKEKSKPSYAQKLAFILQGLESELLRTLIKHHAQSIQFLIHDGIVTDKEIDLAGVVEEIKNRFNVDMIFDYEVVDPIK